MDLRLKLVVSDARKWFMQPSPRDDYNEMIAVQWIKLKKIQFVS